MNLENGFHVLPLSNPVSNGEETQKDLRNSLSLKARLEVIRLANTQQYSSRRLAELFKCGRTQILSTLREKSKYLEVAKIPGSIQRKRLTPKLRFGAVNERVEQWLNEARGQDIIITGPLLQLKAREIASKLGFDHFQASNGWLESFRKRHGISSQTSSSSSSTLNNTNNNNIIPSIDYIYNENDHFSNDPLAVDYEDENGDCGDGQDDSQEDYINPVNVVPEVILQEDELDWKQGPNSSSDNTSACILSSSSQMPDVVHLISFTKAVRHLEDLKTFATAIDDQNMFQIFTQQEKIIKNLIVHRSLTQKSEIHFQKESISPNFHNPIKLEF